MTPFTTRISTQRDNMEKYIKDYLNVHHELILKGDQILDLYNNDELQPCTLRRLYRSQEADYLIEHKGTLNEFLDDIELMDLNTDILAILCDRIQFKEIEYGK